MLTAEEKAKFQNNVCLIAEHLGLSPEFAPMDNGYRRAALMEEPDGAIKLHIEEVEYGANKGRFIIMGLFPRTAKGEYAGPRNGNFSITVAPSKTGPQVAGEIKRRLFPAYLAELKATCDRIEKADAYESRRKETIQKVADFLGAPVNPGSETVSMSWDKVPGLNSYIQAYSDEKVKFDLTVPPEMAIKILALLKAENNPKAAEAGGGEE